ncbi:MAG: type II toxin-antitoxin system HicB family antitoxin [Deferrisomatales bacterium]
MNVKVVIEKGQDGFYSAHCPALKSCWSQGRTKEEAVENLKEAIELYLEPEADEGDHPSAGHETRVLAL